jgi:hypothetical protein
MQWVVVRMKRRVGKAMKTPTRMAMAVAMEALRLLVVQMILLVNIMVRVAQGVPCRSSLCFSSVGLSPCRMARDAGL